jgi:hypothetical protein
MRLDSVIAIDILLEPDAVMIDRSTAANSRLLKAFPEGFALDAAHHPHITMLQRYVRAADLDRVCAAAANVVAGEQVTGWNLEAFKYYYIPYNFTLKGDWPLRNCHQDDNGLLRLQQN